MKITRTFRKRNNSFHEFWVDSQQFNIDGIELCQDGVEKLFGKSTKKNVEISLTTRNPKKKGWQKWHFNSDDGTIMQFVPRRTDITLSMAQEYILDDMGIFGGGCFWIKGEYK